MNEKNDINHAFRTRIMIVFYFLGAITVLWGAVGAHLLQPKLTPDQISSFDTAVLFQFLHIILGLIVSYTLSDRHQLYRRLALFLCILGICLFSGSIYLLTLDELVGLNLSLLGPITPIGGICLAFSWVCAAISYWTKE